MQSVIRSSTVSLSSPKITLRDSGEEVGSEAENTLEDVDMSQIYTGRNSIFSSIATRPLNLTLLNKRKRQEISEMSNQGSSEDEEEMKKPRVSDNEEENIDVTATDAKENYSSSLEPMERQDAQKDSRSSILQHFYSFIQRKVDKGEMDSKDKQESVPEEKEEKNRNPQVDERQSSPVTGDKSLPELPVTQNMTENNNYALDYNSLISQRLARANANNLLEFWSSLGNMYARAKRSSDDGSHQGTSPPLVPYETQSGTLFNSSPTPSSVIPERTMRQNNWAVKVWRDWATERNARASANGKMGEFEVAPLDIKDATLERMSYWLPKFITEVRRRDKRPYPPDTLMQIASGLQRHLRHVSGRNDITFFDKYSPTFAQFREALKARSEAINSESSISQRGDHETPSEGGYAGSDACGSLINLTTAKGIFRAIFYYNCVAFHITSMEEHHALSVSQYKIEYDDEKRQEYLEFTRDHGSQPVRKYATQYDPRCIVTVFKTYFQHIPSGGLLYKRPLQSSESSDLRFSFNPVGINKLRETFKLLFGGRRSGAHAIGGIDDEDDKEAMQSMLGLHPNQEDLQRVSVSHLERSPISETSSGASLCSRRGSSAENLHPEESEQNLALHTPKVEEKRSIVALLQNHSTKTDKGSRPNILVENNNNNALSGEEEDCLTLKVPTYVKYVMIQQGSKRIKIDLDTMT